MAIYNLPINIGDTVYLVSDCEIRKDTVFLISIDEDGVYYDCDTFGFDSCIIGKRVFTNELEAETELKRQKRSK